MRFKDNPEKKDEFNRGKNAIELLTTPCFSYVGKRCRRISNDISAIWRWHFGDKAMAFRRYGDGISAKKQRRSSDIDCSKNQRVIKEEHKQLINKGLC